MVGNLLSTVKTNTLKLDLPHKWGIYIACNKTVQPFTLTCGNCQSLRRRHWHSSVPRTLQCWRILAQNLRTQKRRGEGERDQKRRWWRGRRERGRNPPTSHKPNRDIQRIASVMHTITFHLPSVASEGRKDDNGGVREAWA